MNKQHAFTLIDLSMTLLLVAILAAVAIPRFTDVSDSARGALVAGTRAALEGGLKNHRLFWGVAGAPGSNPPANVTLNVHGVDVRFRNGYPLTTSNSNHVPAGIPNRNSAAARLFFLFLQPAPGPIVARNGTDIGWAMLANNACLPIGRPRCWEYRVNGARYARITYSGDTGEFVVD